MARWYLIHAKPGCETVAQANLERQSYRVYYPRLLRRLRSRGRWVERIGPLFPRYLFLHLDVGREALGPVRSTVGVANVVRFGCDYTVVPDAVVLSLKDRADPQTGLHRLNDERVLAPGSSLRIVAGVFEGLEGVFQRESADERVVVLLKLLGQETSVQIPADFVLPQAESRTYGRIKHAYG
jgi:transcriptional antiterminator RfaH